MNKNTLFLIAILILILGGVLGFGLLKQRSTLSPGSADKTSQNSTMSMSDAITVKGFNYGFSPETITVKEGDMVMLNLISDDSPHTFTIDELGINQQFTWGKDASVMFTASKKGTFQFYCAVPGHKENGQVGTLIVE